MFVCLLAYGSRTDVPICTQLGMLIPSDHKGNIGGSKLRKSIMSSISGEGSSCSSENKNDRRTAPRPKLFVSERRLQKQRPWLWKAVLGSSPNEDVFSFSETKYDRTVQITKLFVSARRLQELRLQTRKLSLVRVSVTKVGFRDNNFSIIFSDTYRMIRPMISFRAIKIDKKWNHLLNFPAVTLRALC
jgi:hypothetical protein